MRGIARHLRVKARAKMLRITGLSSPRPSLERRLALRHPDHQWGTPYNFLRLYAEAHSGSSGGAFNECQRFVIDSSPYNKDRVCDLDLVLRYTIVSRRVVALGGGFRNFRLSIQVYVRSVGTTVKGDA